MITEYQFIVFYKLKYKLYINVNQVIKIHNFEMREIKHEDVSVELFLFSLLSELFSGSFEVFSSPLISLFSGWFGDSFTSPLSESPFSGFIVDSPLPLLSAPFSSPLSDLSLSGSPGEGLALSWLPGLVGEISFISGPGEPLLTSSDVLTSILGTVVCEVP